MVKSASNKLGLAFGLVLAASPAIAQDRYQASLGQLDLVWRQLLSSVAVKTSQTSASGNQVAGTALKSAEANATAVAQFETRHGISEAAKTFLTGRDQTRAACGPVEVRQMASAALARNREVGSVIADADQAFLSSGRDAAMVQSALNRRRAEFYCSGEEFDAGLCSALAGIGYNTGPKAGDTNAAVFMDGGASGAEEVATGLDFIDRVAPLPTVDQGSNAGSAIARLIALKQGAERSMAREIISGSIMEGLE